LPSTSTHFEATLTAPRRLYHSHPARPILRTGPPLSGEALGTDSVKGENAREFRTLGGLVMARLRRVPQEGDLIEASGYCFEVVDMDGLRVDKVLITPPLHEE